MGTKLRLAHMESLESLLQNVEEYVKILEKCRTPHVRDWKEKDLKRALNWAKHFKNVHAKIMSIKSEKRRLFEEKLDKLVSKLGGVKFEGKRLCIDFFKTSLEYLVKALVENAALPQDHKTYLLSEYKDVFGEGPAYDDSAQILACLQKLSKLSAAPGHPVLQSSTSYSIMFWSSQGENFINAAAITQDLTLQAGSTFYDFSKKLDTVIQAEGGKEGIILCLLHVWTKPTDMGQSVQDIILQWMREKYEASPPSSSSGAPSQHEGSTLMHSQWLFSDVSPQLLSLVAADNLCFFQVYLDLLTRVTESKELVCLVGLKGAEGVTEEMLPFWKALFDNATCHQVTVSRIFEKAGPTSIWQQLYDRLME